jgi:hypothetical protein
MFCRLEAVIYFQFFFNVFNGELTLNTEYIEIPSRPPRATFNILYIEIRYNEKKVLAVIFEKRFADFCYVSYLNNYIL